jgi:hypothetical protein
VKTGRWLVVLGCVLSFGTAILHSVGYRSVSAAISVTNSPPVLVAAFKCLWMVFSVQFIVLSAVGVAAMGSSRGKQLVLLCSLVPIFDAGLMLYFIGPFLGAYCVIAVAVALFAGGILLPAPAKS